MMNPNTSNSDLAKSVQIAEFRFALIAPVIQGLFPDASRAESYRRITEKPFTLPDGSIVKYKPKNNEKWASNYHRMGFDGLLPKERSDKGSTRVLPDVAIERIYQLKKDYPRLNATQIHAKLIEEGMIPATVSVCAVQRFVKRNDLKGARNLNIRDRKAFEEEAFGRMWQADYPDVSFIPIFSAAQRNNALDKRKHRDKISYNRPYAFLKSTSDISLTSDSFLRRGWFWSVAASIAFLFISVSAYA